MNKRAKSNKFGALCVQPPMLPQKAVLDKQCAEARQKAAVRKCMGSSPLYGFPFLF